MDTISDSDLDRMAQKINLSEIETQEDLNEALAEELWNSNSIVSFANKIHSKRGLTMRESVAMKEIEAYGMKAAEREKEVADENEAELERLKEKYPEYIDRMEREAQGRPKAVDVNVTEPVSAPEARNIQERIVYSESHKRDVEDYVKRLQAEALQKQLEAQLVQQGVAPQEAEQEARGSIAPIREAQTIETQQKKEGIVQRIVGRIRKFFGI